MRGIKKEQKKRSKKVHNYKYPDDVSSPSPPFKSYAENGIYYCCLKKCFIQPNIQVDGLACDKCWSFNCCHCNCSTWMNDGYKKQAKQTYGIS